MSNFLSIVWYRILPPRYGGQKGIAHFNENLAEKVSLTCLCSSNNEINQLLPYSLLNTLPTSKLQFWNPLVRRRILSTIRSGSFTHIIIEHPYHGWLGAYKQKEKFRFIVHAHNIEHLRMKARKKPWWKFVRSIEEQAFSFADHILFKTEEDKLTALKLFSIPPSRCLVIPFGIDAERQPQMSAEQRRRIKDEFGIREERMLVFASSPDYEPNSNAIETITKNIVPLLEKKSFRYKLLITGDLSKTQTQQLTKCPNIIPTGFVSSFEDLIQAADVFINPVIHGSGTQTKNIEAVAMGCNVVTSAFSSSGLPEYLINEKVFVSRDEDWDHFVENIFLASSVSKPVPASFYYDYNWKMIIRQLLAKTL
ncbi:MAG: glycosyltransferase family 4 protein [Chitinophagaceae bacterium]|nr:glycosyltransferase family 4 protein [Chitinophagaceae bacterium]